MKYGFLAAGMALALSVPALAEAQTMSVQPAPVQVVPSGPMTATVTLAPMAPPAPQVEAPPPAPGPSMVWKPGHWSWNPGHAQYAWVEGSYVAAPTVTASWTQGHWEQRPDGWVWIDGHWN